MAVSIWFSIPLGDLSVIDKLPGNTAIGTLIERGNFNLTLYAFTSQISQPEKSGFTFLISCLLAAYRRVVTDNGRSYARGVMYKEDELAAYLSERKPILLTMTMRPRTFWWRSYLSKRR